MKILTREDIEKLNDEYDLLERWNTVKAWAEKYYGVGKASKVEIEIEYRFNDGDPEYPSVEAVYVSGENDTDIEPDESLPAFDEIREVGSFLHPEDLIEKDELPTTPDSETYDLTKEPVISYPSVVVLDPIGVKK